MSDDPVLKPADPLFPLIKPVEPQMDKPALQPLVGKPGRAFLEGDMVDGPIVHGEAAQRFVNKNAAHSERVMQGKIVTVSKERYEHPERKA